jgi:hypothetical protein
MCPFRFQIRQGTSKIMMVYEFAGANRTVHMDQVPPQCGGLLDGPLGRRVGGPDSRCRRDESSRRDVVRPATERTTSALNPTHGTPDRPQRRGKPHAHAVHLDKSDYLQSVRSASCHDVGRACLVIVMAAAILLLQSGADAQRREVFEARLTAVPVDTVTVRTTTGSGSLTAVLEGNTLTLAGKFDGLNSPATAAHVHRARKGLRGPNVFDLTVTKATSGTIEGTLKLTPAQVEELAKAGYYVQIHTEKNSDGHLRGWLLK